MTLPKLSPLELNILAGLAVFGLVVPNGVFIYYALTRWEVVQAAMNNPVAMVFMIEAFFLMFLFAWLLYRLGCRKPEALGFIVLSLLGSMVFSVPLTLHLIFKRLGREDVSS